MLETVEIGGLLLLIGASVTTFLVWRNIRVRQGGRRRLGTFEHAPEATEWADTRPAGRFVRARPWFAYLAGASLALGLYFFTGLGVSFALAFGFIAGLMGAQLDQFRVERKTALIEAQLADSLDLMISALSAGTGVSQALEVAAQETRAPLRPQLENVINRIRYGDDPQIVLQTLESNVPLTTFRLFAAALSVHWEVGGSLTGPLAVVARVIRDRIELGRRVHALTMQSRVSLAAVLGTTYFIAAVMWRTDPDRMRAFLGTSLGQWFMAAAVMLQGVGIVWSGRMGRLQV